MKTNNNPTPIVQFIPRAFLSSSALGINNIKQIVGASETAQGKRAFVWNEIDGMIQLDTLLEPEYDDWTIYSASAINDFGWIAASGQINFGKSHGLVLIPVAKTIPEPKSLYLLLIGLFFTFLDKPISAEKFRTFKFKLMN